MTKPVKTRLLLDLDGRPGGFNMAADEHFALVLPASGFEAVLRFYRWSTPTVSLGCHQLVDAIQLERCRELGWDVVYRPTGGRALLHDRDLSYAIAVRSENHSYELFRRLYKQVGDAIVQALGELGLEAAVTVPDPIKARREGDLRAGLCLDSRVRGEVTVSGKKIAAAAQHVYRQSLLQHGSIMLEGDPGAIALVSDLPEQGRERMKARLRARAGALRDFLNHDPDVDGFVILLQEALVRLLNLELCEAGWREEELALVTQKSTDFTVVGCEMTELV
jgi:lipoate-protein ligase A